MGRLHQIGNLIIRVYGNDHLPPHFHVITPDHEALVEIETFAIRAGSLPTKSRTSALGWATENRERIIAEWNRLNPRFPVA